MIRTITTAALFVALLLPACKKAAESPNEAETPSSAPVARLVQGYWLPSADSIFEMGKAHLEQNPPPGGLTEELLAEMRKNIEASAGSFMLHLENGKTRALAEERVDTGTYELASVDEAAGTFTATLAEHGGETVTGEGSVTTMTLKLSAVKDAPQMELERSTKEEWDRRMTLLND